MWGRAIGDLLIFSGGAVTAISIAYLMRLGQVSHARLTFPLIHVSGVVVFGLGALCYLVDFAAFLFAGPWELVLDVWKLATGAAVWHLAFQVLRRRRDLAAVARSIGRSETMEMEAVDP